MLTATFVNHSAESIDMALKPSSFLRNPLLLALLVAASIPAALFFFCSGQSACPAKSQSNVERTELAKVHVDASNQIATLEAKRAEVKSQKGWLGVQIQTLNPKRAEYAGVKNTRGVLILDVQENMPAENAGFRDYDVVTHFNGQRVVTHCQLKRRVMSTKAGTRVPVRVIRNGVAVVLYPTLTNSPKANSRCKTGCK